jgi:putative DNA primase/helicase
MPEFKKTEINLPNLGNDRMTDNWIPLATIAYTLYEDWYDKAVEAMRELSDYHVDANDSAAIMILGDIRTIFETQHADRLSSEDIINALSQMDDRPWPEWRNGKSLTKAGLARLLKPFKIAPATIRIGSTTAKGYLLDHFLETFSRYIPSIQSVTPSQVRKNSNLEKIQSVTQKNDVTDKNKHKSLNLRTCYDVTDKNTPSGRKDKKEVVL